MALTQSYKASGLDRATEEWQTMIQSLSAQPERRSLPALGHPLPPIQVWKVIKEAFGSSKIMAMPLPMQLHEPTSELMKRAEDLAYASLLNEAVKLPKHSIERHLKVAAFALSFCASNVRTSKPCLPMLGETYELVDMRQGFRLLVEEVYQDAKKENDIGAWQAEGTGWELAGECEPLLKFSMTGSIDILGHTWIDHLTFMDGESFTWSKMTTRISNLMLGKQTISCHGEMVVRGLEGPGRVIRIKFLEPGYLSRRTVELGQVEGTVEEKPKGAKLKGWKLHGNYHTRLEATSPDGSTSVLWVAAPAINEPRYGMSAYVLQFNHITEGLRRVLPPTDTRLRPDLRLLEEGSLPQAEAENRRLDKLNRERVGAIGKGPYPAPRWFEKCEHGPASEPAPLLRYRYKGGYWEAREAGFPGIAEIFSGTAAS